MKLSVSFVALAMATMPFMAIAKVYEAPIGEEPIPVDEPLAPLPGMPTYDPPVEVTPTETSTAFTPPATTSTSVLASTSTSTSSVASSSAETTRSPSGVTSTLFELSTSTSFTTTTKTVGNSTTTVPLETGRNTATTISSIKIVTDTKSVPHNGTGIPGTGTCVPGSTTSTGNATMFTSGSTVYQITTHYHLKVPCVTATTNGSYTRPRPTQTTTQAPIEPVSDGSKSTRYGLMAIGSIVSVAMVALF